MLDQIDFRNLVFSLNALMNSKLEIERRSDVLYVKKKTADQLNISKTSGMQPKSDFRINIKNDLINDLKSVQINISSTMTRLIQS